MPKVTLEFNLPEENEEFKACCNAASYVSALNNVRQELFRPARKHGYTDRQISDLLEKLGGDGEKLIGFLEDKFSQILMDDQIYDI
jgi:hypothetical protein